MRNHRRFGWSYRPGSFVMWSAFSSCSRNPEGAFVNGGGKGRPVAFHILSHSARSLLGYSMYDHELEAIFLPGSQFRVKERIDFETRELVFKLDQIEEA